MAGRGLARLGGVWEVVGVLAAVVPCGVLAGLYLATDETGFIVACVILAALAGGIIAFKRNPRRRLSHRRKGAEGGATGRAGAERLRAVGSALGRTFTRPVMKVLGFALWILAWGVTAALYARVVSNAQIGGLVMLVLVGGFSPLVIYFGLESGVKKLSGRVRDRE
jgi:hypothetical protein